MDQSIHQIIMEEIQDVFTGLILNYASASHGDFYANTIVNSAYILNRLFKKLKLRGINACPGKIAAASITLFSLAAQAWVANQRNQENRWNETISLAEIGCNFVATAAPAIITFFQHHRASGSQSETSDNRREMSAAIPRYYELNDESTASPSPSL